MASTPSQGLRLYGVIDADSAPQHQLDTLGIGVVSYRELAAVVAPTAYVRAKQGDAELQDFVRVVDALSANGPMIPAPPGTVFRNESVVSRWLDVHYAKLHEALAMIERRSDGHPAYDYVRMELGG